MRFISIIFVAALAAGCQTPSVNVQRSFLRVGGDTSVTFYLDTVDAAKLVETQTKIGEICDAMETFINTGNVAALPLAKIEAQLKRVVPAKYQRWIGTVLAAVSAASFDVNGAIGAANVKRIMAAIIGVRIGSAEYSATDRNSTADAEPPPTAHEPGTWTAVAWG